MEEKMESGDFTVNEEFEEKIKKVLLEQEQNAEKSINEP